MRNILQVFSLIFLQLKLAENKKLTNNYYAIPRDFFDSTNVLTTASDDFFDEALLLEQTPFFTTFDLDKDTVSANQRPQQSQRLVRRDLQTRGDTDYGGNISRIFKHIHADGRYDKRIRPNYKGRPVNVGVTLFISDISHVSEVNMDVTLEFYFRQFWQDPRLDFHGIWDEEIVVGGQAMTELWRPDTFFVNAKQAYFHQITMLNSFLRITPSGNVTQSLRLTVVASCPMDFTYFPMDSQNCRLEIESYGYTMRDIAYKWGNRASKIGAAVKFAPEVHLLPQFRIRGHRELYKEEHLSTGNYSRLTLEVFFERSLGYYVIQVYMPSSLIVVLSQLSFWISRDQPPARVPLGITTVLTMRTLIASTNASLPKISYLKAIDVYLVSCFVMVVAALLEYAAVTYTAKRCRMVQMKNSGFSDGKSCCFCCRLANAKASDIEKYSRVAFPGIFLAFNIAYWFAYLNLSFAVESEGFISAH